MGFQGKIALVTGAGQGIGKAIALGLAREGSDIIVNDLNPDFAENTAMAIRNLGVKAMSIQANVAEVRQVDDMVAKVVKEWGGIDILVNNAGTGRPSMVEDMDKIQWDEILNINLGGVFNCSKALIFIMKARGGGKIINIASMAGKYMSYYGGADYTASKAAVLGFTRHLAFEVGPYGIAVNAVCPGVTLTPLVMSDSTEEMRQTVVNKTPLRDYVKPEDIADAVVFLASERARMITGSAIEVDGGMFGASGQDWETYVRTRKELIRMRS